jgi:hypothetical protein
MGFVKTWRLIILGGGVLALLLVALVFAMRRPPELPDFLEKIAEQEAYRKLLEGTQMLVGDPSAVDKVVREKVMTVNGKVTEFRESREKKLAAFVAKNSRAYGVVEKALNEPVEAPAARYERGHFNMGDFVSAKQFASTLMFKGELAEAEKRYDDAARAYFDSVRLGEKIEHGPMINYLVGAAIERGGLKRLEKLMVKLSAAELRHWAAEVQALNRGRMPFKEIIRREDYFMARNATNIIDAVRVRFFSKNTAAVIDKTLESHTNLRAQAEVLAATMAAVAHTRDYEGALTNVAQLTPKHLKVAPVDPYDSSALKMVGTTNGPVFYSIGKNHVDEGGKGDDVALKFEDATAYEIMFRALSVQ